MQAPTIFISGTGRSGTNITKAIFGLHSQCAILPFEYRFTIDPGGLVDFINSYSATWSPYSADKKIKDLESYLLSLSKIKEQQSEINNWISEYDATGKKLTPYPYAGWELEKWIPGYQELVKTLIKDLIDFEYNGRWPGTAALISNNSMYFSAPTTKEELIKPISVFLNSCINSILTKDKKKVFVEDNTWSILYAADLLKILPQGRMLHIRRDPRDVIASLIGQKWCPNDLTQILKWYKSVIGQWEKQKSILDKSQYLEIDFENIINNTTETVEKMCEFANISFEEKMVSLDLSKANIGRYKKQFSQKEIELIDSKLMQSQI
ncbi:MAG: sulfotransferase [Saprospiraceae bacterium]